MRILILVNSFPPEIRSASHLFYELSESLVYMGHQVVVVTGFPSYTLEKVDQKYKGRLFLREKMNGIDVVRLATFPFPRSMPFARALDHSLISLVLSLGGLISGKQDVVLAYSPPLTLGLSGYFLSRAKRMSFIFNMQDIYPQCLIDIGILKNPALIKFFRAMENWIYKKADYITVHSEGNRQYLLSKKSAADGISVIPNWVDTNLIKPSSKFNRFRQENGIDSKFVVSFAGVMGYAQGLDTVIDSASLLEQYNDVLFLLVGDGVKKQELQEKSQALKLDNIRFLPMQPRELYPLVLAASDVCLVTLKRGLKTPVVPAKLLSIMASGRPVVASVELAGDTPKIVKAANCGYCVEPGEPEKLAQAILDLYKNPSLRNQFGRNGRLYAERHFSRDTCVKEYERIFSKAIEHASSDAASTTDGF
jgi:colanic acid biosynthesis glycosyl transferase WcaI